MFPIRTMIEIDAILNHIPSGFSDGTVGQIHNDGKFGSSSAQQKFFLTHLIGNSKATIYALDLGISFNTKKTNISGILDDMSKTGGFAANNIAPNYVDGALLSNDNEYFFYGYATWLTCSEVSGILCLTIVSVVLSAVPIHMNRPKQTKS